MHEAAVAENLMESITAALKGHSGNVKKIVISCGQISAVNDEAMQFAFKAAAQGSVCESAVLLIKHIPLKAECRDCLCKFDYDFYEPDCPNCKGGNCKIGQDAPLILEEIELEEDENEN